VADARLREVLEILGTPVKVEQILVTTSEQAEEWAFNGSPTVFVDGSDPFAQPGAPIGLACRRYRTPDAGRRTPEGVGGYPTVDQLVEILSRA